MAPSTTVQRELMVQIAEATGITEKNILKIYLRSANYNVNAAVDAILDAGLGSPATSQQEAALSKQFDTLRNTDRDDKDSISAESTMSYLTSMGVDLENAEFFVAAETVQAPSLGEITRKGFIEGWKSANVQANTASQQAFIRKRVAQLATDPVYFKRVYRHAFVACKEADQRALTLENAIVLWGVMFSSSPPGRAWKSPNQPNWLDVWVEFLNEKWTRSVNRDMWFQTLEFANRTMEDETLGFWSEDGAWPGVVDEFVAWWKEKYGRAEAMETGA